MALVTGGGSGIGLMATQALAVYAAQFDHLHAKPLSLTQYPFPGTEPRSTSSAEPKRNSKELLKLMEKGFRGRSFPSKRISPRRTASPSWCPRSSQKRSVSAFWSIMLVFPAITNSLQGTQPRSSERIFSTPMMLRLKNGNRHIVPMFLKYTS